MEEHLSTLANGLETAVIGGTPMGSKDIADVISQAVRAAVEPLRNELAGTQAELDYLKSHTRVRNPRSNGRM